MDLLLWQLSEEIHATWPAEGSPVFVERVYKQNIEQLEKARTEWEQEHRTTCEASGPLLHKHPSSYLWEAGAGGQHAFTPLDTCLAGPYGLSPFYLAWISLLNPRIY